MPRDDLLRVRHILDAAQKALSFVQGKTRDDIDNDEKLALSLIRLLEIVGEAANTISDDFRSRFPEIPWRKMIGLRHRLIHGYFDIDLNIVWDTVTTPILHQIGRTRHWRGFESRLVLTCGDTKILCTAVSAN